MLMICIAPAHKSDFHSPRLTILQFVFQEEFLIRFCNSKNKRFFKKWDKTSQVIEGNNEIIALL